MPETPPPAPRPDPEDVRLTYVANAAIRVRGTVTGRTYEFSRVAPVQSVDPRDAGALLRTGLFRAA